MRTLVRHLLLAVFLSGLIALVEPWVEMTIYTAQLASRPAPASLPIPVDRVRVNALRDSWHAARTAGRRHEGVDIFAPKGTPVRSTTEGVVARIGNSRLGGLVVWVIGPGGHRHYYAHLDRVAGIHRGQRIEAGTLLGYVGNTGNARGTPPHLHYGIYTGRGPINPFPLLRGGPTGRVVVAGAWRHDRRHREEHGPRTRTGGLKRIASAAGRALRRASGAAGGTPATPSVRRSSASANPCPSP